ncbi:hypothetical protein CQA66_00855 [Helicobacter aurati]|uniref:RDD family protein n=1 Tax=Helicobacter aurati TaxID=137778 RepID=A0A3D8J9I7_9HELI|nr:RDD family protein [Helicobacter aurati]RDU73766.1 hypothetical protein CQA66_00855 [Helicobacter aurati]
MKKRTNLDSNDNPKKFRTKANKAITNKFLDGRSAKESGFYYCHTQSFSNGFLIPRLKAFITDMFLINMPLLYITTYLILDGKQDFLGNQIAIMLCVLCYCAILFFFLWKANQTPGFRYAEIMLVGIDSNTCRESAQRTEVHSKRYGTISHRESFVFYKPKAWQCCVFLIVWLIELSFFLWIIYFLRKDKRSLHEVVSGTKIIYKENPARKRQ